MGFLRDESLRRESEGRALSIHPSEIHDKHLTFPFVLCLFFISKTSFSEPEVIYCRLDYVFELFLIRTFKQAVEVVVYLFIDLLALS